ncbi:MAG: histidine kinase [Firmicutes bacterium]|nr:histidine kinase [Bacillota bacterium]
MTSVNIALHLFATIIILILMIGSFAEKKIDARVPLPLLLMMVLDLVMLMDFPAGELIMQITQSDHGWVLPFKAIHHGCFYGIYFEFLVYLKNEFSPNATTDRRLLKIAAPVYILATLIWITYSIFDALPINETLRRILWPLSRYAGITVPFLTSWMLYRCRERLEKSDWIIMVIVLIVPIIGMMIRSSFPLLQTQALSSTLSILLVYGFVHLNQAYRIKDQQLELARNANTIMLSQIRPHFLYNTLNSIYVLCGKDPKRAQEAISDFSEYLRANMGNTSKPLISIDQEMEHVQHYLALEKIRFGDQLDVQYRFGAHGFLVPPLSVQPIVENAVKHGLGKKENGGSLIIETYSDETSGYIKVIDNGVGFDPSTLIDQDETHIGLSNVKKRLEQVHGDLSIVSSPGKGTTVTITIRRRTGASSDCNPEPLSEPLRGSQTK